MLNKNLHLKTGLIRSILKKKRYVIVENLRKDVEFVFPVSAVISPDDERGNGRIGAGFNNRHGGGQANPGL